MKNRAKEIREFLKLCLYGIIGAAVLWAACNIYIISLSTMCPSTAIF